MPSPLAAKTFAFLAAATILSTPALAVTRWIPLPVSKAAAMSDSQPAPDAAEGAGHYKNCSACHEIGPDATTLVGPQLTGIVGRPAASLGDYAYSQSLTAAGKEGLVWLPELLDEYLAAPSKFVPGNKMAFVGLDDAKARRDLIAYLATFEAPEPEPAPADAQPQALPVDQAPSTKAAPSQDQQP